MIGVGLVSPAVWPYYQRHPATGPPPMARTPLGTAADDSGAIEVVELGTVTLAAGETLLAATCYPSLADDQFELAVVGPLPAWTTLKYDGGNGLTIAVGWVAAGLAPYSGTLQYVWIAGDLPANAACLAVKVSSLNTTVPHDKQATANGGFPSSGTQDSGLTGATSQAVEFIWGIIGTNGRNADTVGTWDAPLVAGQSIGTTGGGVQIKEGYYLASGISNYRARVTGATARRWVARCDTFKGL